MKNKNIRCKHRHTIKEHPRCFIGNVPKKNMGFIPRVLLVDIETLPMRVFAWTLSQRWINPDNIISDSFIVAWSAKWLFGDEVFSEVLTPDEAVKQDDKRILGSLWKLLDEANVVMAHNASDFDVKRINTRLLLNGFNPPSFYRVIDTLTVIKDKFAFSSNKLDYVNSLLGIGQKTKTSFELWIACYDGNPKALKEMQDYNKNDVVILEETYVRIRPWISRHPNLSIYVDTDKEICPLCLSDKLIWSDHTYDTNLGRYRSFRCECGAIGRSRVNLLTKERRAVLAVAV